MAKLTFKKGQPATGLARVAEPYVATSVKLSGKVIGYIRPPHRTNACQLWSVALQVYSPHRCGWRNVIFSCRHENEPAARVWLNNNIDRLTKLYAVMCED